MKNEINQYIEEMFQSTTVAEIKSDIEFATHVVMVCSTEDERYWNEGLMYNYAKKKIENKLK